MFIVENYSVAVVLCVMTMLCWGSWANTQKLAAATWRFELFYWDYVIGIVLLSLLLGLTVGSMGDRGRAFIPDIEQGSSENIGSAILGGVIFNAANILLVASIAVAGMAVAFPVGIGLALVIGVIVNFVYAPVGNVYLLFGGAALVVLAIILNAVAYRRLMSGAAKVSAKGLVLAVIAGCLMGLFYKYVAASMFPDFHSPLPGKLSPYSAGFFFSLGILGSNFLFNSLLIRYPVMGEPTSYRAYFAGSMGNHLTGILGGGIWCLGMSLSIIASGAAGPAISYGLGQGATVIAALWGIFIWKEFRNAPKGANTILHLMLALFAIGLAMIVVAR